MVETDLDCGVNEVSTYSTLNSKPSTITMDNMETRSGKVRKLLGEKPSRLIRWGTVIITIIFILLIAAVSLLPYPYSDGETILNHIF